VNRLPPLIQSNVFGGVLPCLDVLQLIQSVPIPANSPLESAQQKPTTNPSRRIARETPHVRTQQASNSRANMDAAAAPPVQRGSTTQRCEGVGPQHSVSAAQLCASAVLGTCTAERQASRTFSFLCKLCEDFAQKVFIHHIKCLDFIHKVLRSCLVPQKFYKIFQILRHIESLNVCMEY